MNYYYVDTTVSTNGDGSADSPFKSLKDALSVSLNHPFVMTLIAGQSEFVDSYINTWPLVNSSGTMSYIKCDGIYTLINYGSATFYGNMSWVTISGLKILQQGGVETQTKAEISIQGDSNNIGNVWFDNCIFENSADTVGSDKLYAVLLKGYDNTPGVSHQFGITNSKFIRTSGGVNLMGNTAPTTTDNNAGDNLRSYGAKVTNTSFIDVSADAIIFNGCASKNGDPVVTDDEWASIAKNITYSSHQYKSVLQYTNPFWFVHSNNCMFENVRVYHQQGTTNDKTSFDFDEMSWGCVLKDCYSTGSGGGFLLTSAWSQDIPSGSGYSDYEYYYTRRFGSGNHRVINCTSFNDGVLRGVVKLQGHMFNVSFENCNIIRTDAYNSDYDMFPESWISQNEANLDAYNMKVCTFTNVNFVVPFYTPRLFINWTNGWGDHDKLGTAYVDFNDCNLLFKSGTTSSDFGSATLTNCNITSGDTPFSNGSAWSQKTSVDKAVSLLF